MSATHSTQVQPDVRQEGIRMKGIDLLAWAATLLAFPIAGLAARAVAGPVDEVWTARAGGCDRRCGDRSSSMAGAPTDRRRSSLDRCHRRRVSRSVSASRSRSSNTAIRSATSRSSVR